MTTPRLLVVNPNTSASVTALLQRHVAAACGPAADVHCVTARLGASYIADEASYAVAAHAALDAWADADADAAADAVLLGCFGDPGLAALQQMSPVPVVGLAQAAFAEASARGRFAIVTGGAAWKPMLERLARGWGVAGLAAVHTVAPSGAQLAADPDAAVALLAAACRHAAAGVDAVLLGGAGLAGMAERIAPSVPVPLICSVQAGVRAVLQALAAAPPQRNPAPAGAGAAWSGLSDALLRRLPG